MATEEEERAIAAIVAAMDRRSVMGIVSDLLDLIVSGAAHIYNSDDAEDEKSWHLEGMVDGLLIAFAAAVDGVDLKEGDQVDPRAMRDRGHLLMHAAAEMVQHGRES